MRYIEYDHFSDFFALASCEPRKKEMAKFQLDEFVEKDGIKTEKINPTYDLMPSTILHPHIDSYIGSLDVEKSNYVNLFLAQDGMDSVKRAINRDFSILEIRRMVEDDNTEYIKAATGRVFEHLAHLWIADSMNRKNVTIVDPVATNSLFRKLNLTFGTYVFPDGVMLNHDSEDIIIEHLFEYKMNPVVTADDLETQIEKAKTYFDRFKEKKLFFQYPTNILKSKNIKASTISLGENPQFFVISPKNRNFSINTPGVHLVKTPFGSDFVAGLSEAVVKDIIFGKNTPHVLTSDSSIDAIIEEEFALHNFGGNNGK